MCVTKQVHLGKNKNDIFRRVREHPLKLLCLFYIKKNLFFIFYTLIFIKYIHQFIYFTHLLYKIFIILQFFIILSLIAPLSHRPITTNDPSTPSHHHHHPATIPSSPPNQHHQEKPTHSIQNSVNPTSIQSQTHSSPTQLETPSSQIITHPTWNPLMIWWFDWHGLMIGEAFVWRFDRRLAWLDDLTAASKRWSATMEDDLIKWRKGEWGEMTETQRQWERINY